MSTFPWLDSQTGGRQSARRVEAALRDLRARAGVYYRLGFTADACAQRLAAAVAWEFEPPSGNGGARSAHVRPSELSDQAIAALVRDAYARRPA
ncbi:MAG TPA: hypothetical protein VL463_14735 [Kofleriaceae bacterium]|nr:hypothetical protein [Kofleriaceae bacterium]